MEKVKEKAVIKAKKVKKERKAKVEKVKEEKIVKVEKVTEEKIAKTNKVLKDSAVKNLFTVADNIQAQKCKTALSSNNGTTRKKWERPDEVEEE